MKLNLLAPAIANWPLGSAEPHTLAQTSDERRTIVCVSEDLPVEWRWFEGRVGGPELAWQFFHCVPRSVWETLDRPRIARYAEVLRASAWAAHHRADLIVTHSPALTWWYEEAAFWRRARAPHLAFTFNFTDLPQGLRRREMARAFQRVDRFVVFSTYERELYAEYFGIPIERIDVLHWAVSAPQIAPVSTAYSGPPYVCAVGGNRRDYATLLRAAEATPEISYLLVVRPENVAGLKIPDNVQIEVHATRERCFDVIRNARFMVLPLPDAETACGHVTIVTAMQFAKALVSTDSRGVHDYVLEGETALRVPPRDPSAMAEAVRKLWRDPPLAEQLGRRARAFALEHCSEDKTRRYVETYLHERLP